MKKIDFNNETLTFTLILSKLRKIPFFNEQGKSCEKFECSSCCVSGLHYSSTTTIENPITETCWELIFAEGVKRKREKQ